MTQIKDIVIDGNMVGLQIKIKEDTLMKSIHNSPMAVVKLHV